RILSQYCSWRSNDPSGGAQIDLVISRADNMINICEAKYSAGEYSLTKDESMKLLHRMDLFQTETATKKGIYITLITTYGLAKNMWHDTANSVVTMADLFR
ncbi:MAG: ATP-binding protein, partial [Bacteroidales bacterium]|nr:ATP-binding protein [Bacteroidales bacterium]